MRSQVLLLVPVARKCLSAPYLCVRALSVPPQKKVLVRKEEVRTMEQQAELLVQVLPSSEA